MKHGILLAGGTGSRLFPLTHVVNKHLLGVNGKFIIDYPIATLKSMGCESATVVLGGNHFSQVVDHLTDGSEHGLKIDYVYQGEARGIAQAINLCKRQVSNEKAFAVILGDNVFENPVRFDWDWTDSLDYDHSLESVPDAGIALHKHPELQRFGVATVDNDKKIYKIEEKPKNLDPEEDNYAITGCYLLNHSFFRYFKDLKPSQRGEYEITDILNAYRRDGELRYTFAEGLWSDAGTHESIETVNKYFYAKKESK